MTLKLLLISTLLFLTACATHGAPPPSLPQMQALLAPTVINDRFATMDEVMATPGTTTQDGFVHGGAADRAVANANADKAAALTLLEKWFPPVKKEQPRWKFWRRREEE